MVKQQFVPALVGVLAGLVTRCPAVVTVATPGPERSQQDGGERFVQSVTLANEICHYTLVYDIIRDQGKPDEIRSHWWAWTTGYTTLGMTEPSNANWYFQAFFNLLVDGESLHIRPATIDILRDGGADGMVQYTWELPNATVRFRFALTTGSDKLLLFGHLEPKTDIKSAELRLMCYPTGFAEPRSRQVTTAEQAKPAGERVDLDFAKERWVLYEDTTPGRPGSGSAGLLIGTPDAFEPLSIGVAGYGIMTPLRLKPGVRDFAIALYDFPFLPDREATESYFRGSATREAEWLGQAAAGDLDQPLPPLPVSDPRMAEVRGKRGALFQRPAELWQPEPKPLPFPWAAKSPGGPIRTVLFCQRFDAYESMELARRLELQVEPLYWDTEAELVNASSWPYAGQTGIGPLSLGAATGRALDLVARQETELILVAGLKWAGLPAAVQRAVLDRVGAGAGLLLVGNQGQLADWPPELFGQRDPIASGEILDGVAWEAVPGYRPGERGRITEGPPCDAFHVGQGRVVTLRAGLGTYSVLVPRNDAVEGLDGATDRCLAIAARAAVTAAGREWPCWVRPAALEGRRLPVTVQPAAPAGARLRVRLQDGLDRVLHTAAVPLPLAGGAIEVPVLPTGIGETFADLAVEDAEGRCLGFASTVLAAPTGPQLSLPRLAPATQADEAATPLVDLPDAGDLRATVAVEAKAMAADARLEFEVWDAFDRLLARRTMPLTAGDVTATLPLGRPVTACHRLDVGLFSGDSELAHQRLRFTRPVAYPYDDFTLLVWTYAGGEPVLQRTTRLCYEQGAAMQDLCHMGGYTGAAARREYEVAARSGLSVVPYVTRLAGDGSPDNLRSPCLHDPDYVQRTVATVAGTSRQAAAYSPAAFTLGDENYLFRGTGEVCWRPESVAAFRAWLEAKYGTIAKLNDAWATDYADFAAIQQPMLLGEVAQHPGSFAPWIDHKRFFDQEFARLHEVFADAVRQEVPGAKVGWDGLLGYTWRAGYDFSLLTANLELNQTYSIHWLQNELVRSFRQPGALTGTWANAVADSPGGFAAHPWDDLLRGDNSAWWWTSWGCDYIPFNPDTSLNSFGEAFFESGREIGSGPGKLLLHGRRDDSGIAVLYSHPDLFAAAILGEVASGQPYAGDTALLDEHTGLLRALRDTGHQYQHVSFDQLEAGELSAERFRVMVLPLAMCLSDRQVATLRAFVEAGGTLVVDGRAGFLTGDGKLRPARALDELLGTTSPPGPDGLRSPTASGQVTLAGTIDGTARQVPLAVAPFEGQVLEPTVVVAGGTAFGTAGQAPVVVVHRAGKGRTVLLNLGFRSVTGSRAQDEAHPLLDLVDAVVRSAGCEPPCALTRADGTRPLATQQVLFSDGALGYLGLAQDFLLRGMADQAVHVQLPQAAVVYDVRAGKRVGQGQVSEWDTPLSRGRPLVYALLPYEVTGVSLDAPAEAAPGQTVQVAASVATGGTTGYHVVRLDVYPPGADAPHRQYSQNLGCDGGKGTATIPLALNDPAGEWRLVARDTASGVTAERLLTVRSP